MSEFYTESWYREDCRPFWAAVMRLIGLREVEFARPGFRPTLRFRGLEVVLKPRVGIGVTYSAYERGCLHIGLLLVHLFITVPWTGSATFSSKQWGFMLYLFDREEEPSLLLYWGVTAWVYLWLLRWEWVRTEIIDGVDHSVVFTDAKGTAGKDAQARSETWAARHDAMRAAADRVSYVAPYRYLLRSGEVQEVSATVHVRRMVWQRRYLPYWPARIRTYIDVEFSAEVGERAGSWKGGTVGCSYEMRRGEKPLDTLKRMEQTRRFR